MVSKVFDRAFRRLVQAFGRYHDVPREPEFVIQLASARIDLDVARGVARDARDDLLAARPSLKRPPKQTGVGEDDIARLRVLGTGFVQG
jgi:hypothetical protein